MSISIVSSVSPARATTGADATASHTRATFAPAGLVRDPAQRKAIRLGWKAHVAAMAARVGQKHKGPSARDLAVFCMLLGIPLHRAFTPVTNTVKLANGRTPFDGLMEAVRGLSRRTERGLTLAQLLTALGVADADLHALSSALQAEAQGLDPAALARCARGAE